MNFIQARHSTLSNFLLKMDYKQLSGRVSSKYNNLIYYGYCPLGCQTLYIILFVIGSRKMYDYSTSSNFLFLSIASWILSNSVKPQNHVDNFTIKLRREVIMTTIPVPTVLLFPVVVAVVPTKVEAKKANCIEIPNKNEKSIAFI